MDEIITPGTRLRLYQQQRLARSLLVELRADVTRGDTSASVRTVERLDAVFREHSSLVDAILDVVTLDGR